MFELQSRLIYGLQKELSEVTAILTCFSIKKKKPREEAWTAILTFHLSLSTCNPRLFAVLRRLQLIFLGITADHYFSFAIPDSRFPISRFSNIQMDGTFDSII